MPAAAPAFRPSPAPIRPAMPPVAAPAAVKTAPPKSSYPSQTDLNQNHLFMPLVTGAAAGAVASQVTSPAPAMAQTAQPTDSAKSQDSELPGWETVIFLAVIALALWTFATKVTR